MGLVEQLRAIGLPMGSWYSPFTFIATGDDGNESEVTRRTFVGWTTDEAKATAAQNKGATIRTYRSKDSRFDGYEVIAHEDVDDG